MNRLLVSFFFYTFSLVSVQAQIHEVGLFVGGSNYIGEIGPTTYIAPNNFALGLLYKWNKSPRHSYRVSYTQSKIYSKDSESSSSARKQRNYSFENNIKELSLGLEFNFFDFNLHKNGFVVTPYVYSGLNVFMYDELYILEGETNLEGKKASISIPMTVGIKVKIDNHFVLAFEASARYTFSDNLDGSNPNEKRNKDLQFGNINSNDWYVFTGFTLTYTFGKKPCYCSK